MKQRIEEVRRRKAGPVNKKRKTRGVARGKTPRTCLPEFRLRAVLMHEQDGCRSQVCYARIRRRGIDKRSPC